MVKHKYSIAKNAFCYKIEKIDYRALALIHLICMCVHGFSSGWKNAYKGMPTFRANDEV